MGFSKQPWSKSALIIIYSMVVLGIVGYILREKAAKHTPSNNQQEILHGIPIPSLQPSMTKLPTSTHSAPVILPTYPYPTPGPQGNCPNGYSYFESNDFSICYPYAKYYFYPITGSTDVVFAHDQTTTFYIIPSDSNYQSEQREYTINPCYGNCENNKNNQKETIMISGFPATKIAQTSIP